MLSTIENLGPNQWKVFAAVIGSIMGECWFAGVCMTDFPSEEQCRDFPDKSHENVVLRTRLHDDPSFAPTKEDEEEITFVVNSYGEFGVRLENSGRIYFLYKGNALEYKNEPNMKYRPVGKREFGETLNISALDERFRNVGDGIDDEEYTEGEGWLPLT